MELPTAQTIAEFHVLSDDFKALNNGASDAIVAAKEHHDQEVTIARDGKPLVVKERDLWEEVYHLGPASEAGTILNEKYPEPFELSRQAEQKKEDIKAWAVEKWGINPLAMSLSDIIKLAEAVADLRIQQALADRLQGK
jgi:hypothetical protein